MNAHKSSHSAMEEDKNVIDQPEAPVLLLPEIIQPISDDPPEGGLQAWLTVAGSCLIQFCVWGFGGSPIAFRKVYLICELMLQRME